MCLSNSKYCSPSEWYFTLTGNCAYAVCTVNTLSMSISHLLSFFLQEVLDNIDTEVLVTAMVEAYHDMQVSFL